MDLVLGNKSDGQATFDRLVLKYSGGIPTKAIVDELLRIGAVREIEKGF